MNRKSFLIAAFGSLSQYYDHHLFGFLAAAISKSFTPSIDPTIALLNTYCLMAIAVCAKPIGALILGRIGDIYGRSATLKISLLGTSIASFIISLTPGYHYIGVVAALILLVTRMAIVALVSSGTDGVRIYVYEHIGRKHQCLGTGVVSTSGLAGSLVASVSAWFFTLDTIPHYSWRFAFILGSIMGIMMLILANRNKGVEDQRHKDNPGYEENKNIPTLKIIRQNFLLFITCAVLSGAIGGANHFCVLFFGTYIFELLKYLPHSEMQSYTSIGIIIYMFSAITSGWMADKIGRHIMASIGFIILTSLTIGMLFSIRQGYMPVWLYFAMMTSLPMLSMPALAFVKQSIPSSIRYRIFSLAHAIGSMCISSTTPALATLLFKTTGIIWIPILYFIFILTLIISSIYVLCIKYNANKY